MIGWFLGAFGLVGAVLVTLLATVVAKSFALVRVAALLQVGLAEVLPWAALARLSLRAVVAAVPAWTAAAALAPEPLRWSAAGPCKPLFGPGVAGWSADRYALG